MSQSEPAGELVPMPVQLAPAAPSRGLVRAVAPVADVVAAQAEYHELCRALLDAHDYQRIGSKDFPKKSAWRKLAVAFNVSVELTDRTYERDGSGRIIRAEVVARATAPNGRTMDGLGACDLFEKCCPGGEEGCPIRAQKHRHCRPNCPGTVHFSNASHDLPATAATRATNRACADLFGMGEVSAEEVSSSHAQYEEPPPPNPAVEAGWTDASEHDSHRRESNAIVRGLTEEQKATARSWIEDNTPGYLSLWKKGQAEAYRVLVESLKAEAPAQEPQEAESTPVAAPTPPEAEAPAPAPESAASDADSLPDHVQAIIDQVKAMKLPDVLAALRKVGLADDGKPADLRRRLAEHLVGASEQPF